jgi:hypothetical protein
VTAATVDDGPDPKIGLAGASSAPLGIWRSGSGPYGSRTSGLKLATTRQTPR